MLEPIQWSEAKGKALERQVQDLGSARLALTVNNISELLNRFAQGGARVVTAGAKPILVKDEDGSNQVVVVQGFDGFGVKLVQAETQTRRGETEAPPTSYVTSADVEMTVSNAEKTAQFFAEVFGAVVRHSDSVEASASKGRAYGVPRGSVRESLVILADKSPTASIGGLYGRRSRIAAFASGGPWSAGLKNACPRLERIASKAEERWRSNNQLVWGAIHQQSHAMVDGGGSLRSLSSTR